MRVIARDELPHDECKSDEFKRQVNMSKKLLKEF
jgi:hypothetical protein